MDSEEIEPVILLREVEALIDAAANTTNHDRYELLMRWAHETLAPLVAKRVPEALWLNASVAQFSGTLLSSDELDREYLRRVREAAYAGNANAQFRLACELDEDATYEESARLFQLAAEQGHVYAQWCHGLNLLSGRGIPKDERLGISMIQRAADGKFEGAVQFLSRAYELGVHGFPKDDALAAEWWKKLSDKNLVRY